MSVIKRRFAVATILVVVIILAGVAASVASARGPHGPRSHEHRIQATDAIKVARHYAPFANAKVTIDDASPFHALYQVVDAEEGTANVDAFSGAITTLSINAAFPSSALVRVSPSAALDAASGYARLKGLSLDGLTPVATLLDHGSFREYVVDWTRRVNGALVPDKRQISVNPQTGAIFGVVNTSYPYQAPSNPTVSQTAAERLALDLVGASAGRITTSDLVVWFDAAGDQTLVWRIGVRVDDPVTPTSTLIDVDAISGSTTVLGRG